MKKPAGILFDVGDTLLKENAYDLDAGIRALFSTAGGSEREDVETRLANLHENINQAKREGTAEFSLRQWLDHQLISGRREDFEELELQVWQRTVSLAPMAGAGEMLAVLEADGVVMGAISNTIFSSQAIEYELRRHGMDGFFRFVLSSADIGVRKPDVKVFEHALLRLGIEASDVWFIGDSWECDISGASRAGMFPVWLHSDENRQSQNMRHLKIADWKEFLEVWNSLDQDVEKG